MWNLIAWGFVCLAILSALYLAVLVYRHPEKMKIMNPVWILTGLWASMLGVWAYFRFGQAPMNMPMEGMEMKNTRPLWEKAVLSSLHCGAGCVLADIIGETAGFYIFRHIPGWDIPWQWATDYLLALIIGAYFQYAAIHTMLKGSVVDKLWKALKIDFLSLTGWQFGMYSFMYVVFFVPPAHIFTANEIIFWALMQLAMLTGFVIAYPINYILIRSGYKPAM